MNLKTAEQKNKPGVFVPDTGVEYSEIPDTQLLKPAKVRSVDVEHDFTFLDKSFKARLWRGFVAFVIFTLVWLLSKIRFGLKVEGRKNLHRNRKMLKNGAMTVCNHVHRWDFCFVEIAALKKMFFPAKASNLETKDAALITGAGGIPIPQSVAAHKKFYSAFDELVAKKTWIHAFPESTRWDYYQPVRPFKLGVFKLAYKWNYPVVPMAIHYREPGRLRKFFGLKNPLVTISVGEPISVKNEGNLSRNEFCNQLRKKAHASVVELAQIERNCWEDAGD